MMIANVCTQTSLARLVGDPGDPGDPGTVKDLSKACVSLRGGMTPRGLLSPGSPATSR